jgi:hypothetical protein
MSLGVLLINKKSRASEGGENAVWEGKIINKNMSFVKSKYSLFSTSFG